MLDRPMSRRHMLGVSGTLIAAGTALGALPAPAVARPDRRRVLRLAHLTDLHIQPERRAGSGVAACLRHVQSHADRPGLILTGGDLVMDCFGADEARTRTQWDLFVRTLRDECSLPVRHCLGNHDHWGWEKKASNTTGDEPLWGTRWACDLLGLPGRYYSFDQAGWHFVVLDSTYPDPGGYIGRLDDEQFEWLRGDLAGVPAGTPTLVLSHIPILSSTAMFFGGDQRDKSEIPRSLMHVDAKRLNALFLQHRTVKVCLSGHTHLIDRVDYNYVTYLCNGAVSGNWWKGRHQECDEGYALIDLFDDGTFSHEYVTYGWKAEA